MNTFSTKSKSCFVDGVGSRRITREQVTTLRNIPIGKKSWLRRLAGALHDAVKDLPSLGRLSAIKPRNTMCKYYGHVIEGAWQGYLPKCRDCGCEISSPDQLRKAFPTS